MDTQLVPVKLSVSFKVGDNAAEISPVLTVGVTVGASTGMKSGFKCTVDEVATITLPKCLKKPGNF